MVLAGLVLLGWGMVIYQHNLQKGQENRLRQALLEEMVLQRQAEDSIKQEIYSKERTRKFVKQLERDREIIESLQQQIADTESRFLEQGRQQSSAIATDMGLFKQKQIEDRQQLARHDGLIEGCLVAHSTQEKQLAQYIDTLADYNQRLLSLQEKLAQLEKQMAGYAGEFTPLQEQCAGLKDALDATMQRQEESEELLINLQQNFQANAEKKQ